MTEQLTHMALCKCWDFFFFNHYLETVLFSEIILIQPGKVSTYTRAFRNAPLSEETWGIAIEKQSRKERGKPYNTGIYSTEQAEGEETLSAFTMR